MSYKNTLVLLHYLILGTLSYSHLDVKVITKIGTMMFKVILPLQCKYSTAKFIHRSTKFYYPIIANSILL